MLTSFVQEEHESAKLVEIPTKVVDVYTEIVLDEAMFVILSGQSLFLECLVS